MATKTIDNSWQSRLMKDVQAQLSDLQDKLPHKIQEIVKARLEKWKEVEINFAIIGNTGVGKSSFINAIRGLKDNADGAAKTGVEETTMEAACYPHLTNSKIIFWDLPGVGTKNVPDLENYCKNFRLKKYDTFVIVAAKRFKQNDLDLAKKVKSFKKSFFFTRTKIDEDYRNEKRTRKASFNEKSMLETIRKGCFKNLEELEDHNGDVFLISNPDPTKWDFPRLRKAILDTLPNLQKECLTLSLGVLTKDMMKLKVDLLRGRIWMVAVASAAGAVVPVPGVSMAVDLALIMNEVLLYKSQLGLPEEGSPEFQNMSSELKTKVEKFCISSPAQMAKLLLVNTATETSIEEITRLFVPVIGLALAGAISFYTTYNFLRETLNELEETALEFLDQTVKDFDID